MRKLTKKQQSRKYIKILAVLAMFGAVGFGYILGTTPSVRQAIFGKTVQERQVDELKAHEQEIISFVKAQNPKVTSVQIDWERTDWGQRGPLVTEEVVTVHGHFNHLKN